jgi:single-strand DNA-binding protein
MITLTGNGRLTRDPQLRTIDAGKTVATISVASDRRDRTAAAVYIDLILWEAQASAAAQHLVKGQAVSFTGRFEPREYVTQADDQRVALELHGVDLEYGAKPRAVSETTNTTERPVDPATALEDDDIPF